MRSIFSLLAVAVTAAVAMAAPPRTVKECPDGNCPAVTSAASFTLPAKTPDVKVPDVIVLNGERYVREVLPVKHEVTPAVVAEPCAPCNAAVPQVQYREDQAFQLGSCGVGSRLFGSCSSGARRGPIRSFFSAIFRGGCGG